MNEELKSKQNMPQFLKVLSILSIIWIAFSLLSNVSRLFTGRISDDLMEQQKIDILKSVDQFKALGYEGIANDVQKMIPMGEAINSSDFFFPFFTIVSLVLGLFGIINMRKAKKIGFHFYIIYSLLTVVQPYFFMSPKIIPSMLVFWNIFISGIFVFLYSRNLKWMVN